MSLHFERQLKLYFSFFPNLENTQYTLFQLQRQYLHKHTNVWRNIRLYRHVLCCLLAKYYSKHIVRREAYTRRSCLYGAPATFPI